jgi:plastocyanin
MRRLLQLVTISLVALLVFAPSAWSQGQEVTVRMEDNFFDQANITVEPGTTVRWVQSGNNPHTTTSYDGLWDSGMIEGGSGGTFSFTFEEPGTYDYYCIPHESMGMCFHYRQGWRA